MFHITCFTDNRFTYQIPFSVHERSLIQNFSASRREIFLKVEVIGLSASIQSLQTRNVTLKLYVRQYNNRIKNNSARVTSFIVTGVLWHGSVRIELLYSSFAIFTRCVNSNKCVECEFFPMGRFSEIVQWWFQYSNKDTWTISTWHSFVHFFWWR